MDAYRDWGFAGDYVEAMWSMLQQSSADDYVISTGTTTSVREFLNKVFTIAGLGDPMKYVEIDPRLYRPHEVPYLLGDSSKAQKNLAWKPKTDIDTLAELMYTSDYEAVSKGLIV